MAKQIPDWAKGGEEVPDWATPQQKLAALPDSGKYVDPVKPISAYENVTRTVAGAAGAAADMVAGAPAGLYGNLVNVGTRIGAALSNTGLSHEEVSKAGAEGEAAALDKLPQWAKTPVQTLLTNPALGGPQSDPKEINALIDKTAKAAEAGTKGLVNADDARMFLSSVMNAGGVEGLKTGIKQLAQNPKAAMPAPKTVGEAAADVKTITQQGPTAAAKATIDEYTAILRGEKPAAEPAKAAEAHLEEAKATAHKAFEEEPQNYTKFLDDLATEKLNSPQGGSVDPQLLKWMGVAAGGLVVGRGAAALYQWWNALPQEQKDEYTPKKPPQGDDKGISHEPDFGQKAKDFMTDAGEIALAAAPLALAGKEGGRITVRQATRLAAVVGGAAVGYNLDPDHPIFGAALGGIGGGLAAHFAVPAAKATFEAGRAALQPGSIGDRFVAGIKELTPGPITAALRPDERLRIKPEMDAAEVFTRREELVRSRAGGELMKAAPNLRDRETISHAIEAGTVATLPAKLQAGAKAFQDYLARIGKIGLDAGVISDLIPRYVTHIYGRDALPLLDEMMQARNTGVMSTVFGQARKGLPTIAEINAFMQSKGKPPITADAAEIMNIYGASVIKAVANRAVVDALKERFAKTANGGDSKIPLIAATTKAPSNYVDFGRPGLRAHPDIVPAMRFMFDSESPIRVIRGIEMANAAAKRVSVMASGFHAKSLLDAFVGAASLGKTGLAVGAVAGAAYGAATGKDPLIYALIGAGLGLNARGARIVAQAALPKVFGENRFVKAFRENDPALAKIIDLSLQGGLMYKIPRGEGALPELGNGIHRALQESQQWLDKVIPGAGLAVKGIDKINHAVDGFLWERLHTAMKMEVFMEKYETMMENNVKAREKNPATPLRSEKDIAEAAASFTNDIFGGLNWRRVAEETKTRWGRDIAMGVYSPVGQRIMRLGMFAPDWTISTTRAALKSLGGVVGQEGGGIKGLMSPRTVADLHRQYLVRSAFYYALIGNGLSYAFTGQSLFSQKDWTRIPMGDGRWIQYNKHFFDPYQLLMRPVQTGLNKMGQLPREALNQAFGTEYLSPYKGREGVVAGPEMQEGRLAHAIGTFSPIGVQQFDASADAGLMGAAGMPIHGHTRDQQIAIRRAQVLRKRLEEQR